MIWRDNPQFCPSSARCGRARRRARTAGSVEHGRQDQMRLRVLPVGLGHGWCLACDVPPAGATTRTIGATTRTPGGTAGWGWPAERASAPKVRSATNRRRREGLTRNEGGRAVGAPGRVHGRAGNRAVRAAFWGPLAIVGAATCAVRTSTGCLRVEAIVRDGWAGPRPTPNGRCSSWRRRSRRKSRRRRHKAGTRRRRGSCSAACAPSWTTSARRGRSCGRLRPGRVGSPDRYNDPVAARDAPGGRTPRAGARRPGAPRVVGPS
jgi:hypothetical protein